MHLRAWSLPITSLACPFQACEAHAQTNQGNLRLRKTYGKQQTRLLRCLTCGAEFSETRGTPFFNTKISFEKFVSVVEHISEGQTPTSITRTCQVHHDTIDRIARVTAVQAEMIHNTFAQNLNTTAVQADERHGFAGSKSNPFWEATLPARCVLGSRGNNH